MKVIGAKDFLNDTPTGKFSMEISYVKPNSLVSREDTGFYHHAQQANRTARGPPGNNVAAEYAGVAG